jgi:hypothetical protein
MIVAVVATWVPTALGLALAGGLLWIILVIHTRDDRPDADEPDSDSDGGGGWGKRPPRRPPPVGPVSWPDFERQFAAYVECRGARATHERVRSGARDERAPNTAGDADRAG